MLGRHGVPPMTRFAIILWRVAVLVAAAAASGGVVSLVFAQDLTVRLIDGNDGKPLQKQILLAYLGEGPGIQATTSADGTAVFHLPTPIPDRVLISVENGKLHGCAYGGFSAHRIIETGLVAENNCDPKRKFLPKFAAKPGEVIIFARFLHWWERMQT